MRQLQLQALYKLKDMVTSNEKINQLYHPDTVLNLYGHCLEMEGDILDALTAFVDSRTIYSRNYAANWHIALMIYKQLPRRSASTAVLHTSNESQWVPFSVLELLATSIDLRHTLLRRLVWLTFFLIICTVPWNNRNIQRLRQHGLCQYFSSISTFKLCLNIHVLWVSEYKLKTHGYYNVKCHCRRNMSLDISSCVKNLHLRFEF